MTADPAYLAAFDLSGRVAVVTGGSEGIGRGIVEALGRGGASVVVAARTPAKVSTAESELRAAGLDVVGIPTDVRDETSVSSLFAQTVDRFGHLDILVNSAGGAFNDSFRAGPLLSLDASDFMESYRLNVVATILCTQSAIPLMNQTGGGSIVHIGSPAGRAAAPNLMGAYGASKAALNNLTRTMAIEFGPTVRVNAVLPGHVETPRTKANRTPERVAQALRNSASGRMGTPEDVAGAVCFLCSPAASWISGILLDVDGGRTTGA